MTLDEIRRSGKVTLTPKEAAEVLGCNPQTIRVCAKQQPWRLGFPVCVVGNRVKIPTEGFLKFMKGE